MNSIRRRAVPWVAAVVGLSACLALAQWQTRRADQKLAVERAWIAAEARPALPLADARAVTDAAGSLPRRVAMHGVFRHDKTVWVGNRNVDGRPGLYAVTPLELDNGAGVVLVNRGWRARLPADGPGLPPGATTAPERASVEGLAVSHVPRILEVGEGALQRGLAVVWANLDYGAYERASGLPVAGFVVQQTSDAPDGLVRKWSRPSTGVDKHRGYAFQWYALAALIAVLAIVFGTRRLRRGAPPAHAGRAETARGEGA